MASADRAVAAQDRAGAEIGLRGYLRASGWPKGDGECEEIGHPDFLDFHPKGPLHAYARA